MSFVLILLIVGLAAVVMTDYWAERSIPGIAPVLKLVCIVSCIALLAFPKVRDLVFYTGE